MITSFDSIQAQLLGFKPKFFYYCCMLITCITTVTALNIVGSTVIVALMLAPAATAYLVTERLSSLVWLALLFGCTAALSGYTMAHSYNVSIAGSIACMCGFLFFVIFLIAPKKGLLSRLLFNKKKQRLLLQHIVYQCLKHHGPCTVTTIGSKLGWSESSTRTILVACLHAGTIKYNGTLYSVLKPL